MAYAPADLRQLQSDLFHEDIPDEFIEQVFDVMLEASWHTFQVLTKRPERLLELADRLPWPSNVWVGVSIESRRFVGRADLLHEAPAAIRFISAEPLLGPLDGLNLDPPSEVEFGLVDGSRLRTWVSARSERASTGGAPRGGAS